MSNSIISEGKTTSEAIENGLKKLNVSKKDVDVKIIKEENKKSFFSILDPRVVKVELTIKEKTGKESKKEEYIEKDDSIKEEDYNIIKNNIEKFLDNFIKILNIKNIEYKVINEKKDIKVDINGNDINYLIGYRGEALNSLQTIISRIGNKNLENKHRIILDIVGYREKRILVLEKLADKIARTVEKNGKSYTLEPMSAFERKVIHNRLQNNNKVTTHSIGKEPHRKIVVELR